MSKPNDIELTEPTEVRVSAETLLPVIAKIEDTIAGENRTDVFFALIALAIHSQYTQMTDEQISKGIDRIALNIVQMCQEYEFENKLKQRLADDAEAKKAN